MSDLISIITKPQSTSLFVRFQHPVLEKEVTYSLGKMKLNQAELVASDLINLINNPYYHHVSKRFEAVDMFCPKAVTLFFNNMPRTLLTSDSLLEIRLLLDCYESSGGKERLEYIQKIKKQLKILEEETKNELKRA